MSNPNQPYIDELAAMRYTSDRTGKSSRDLIAAARENGVTSGQLAEATRRITALPAEVRRPEALQEWVRSRYLADGRAKGYIGPDDEPTLWVCGQLANAHYQDGSMHSDTPQRESPA